MILIIIGCIAAAGAIGFVTATLFKAGTERLFSAAPWRRWRSWRRKNEIQG